MRTGPKPGRVTMNKVVVTGGSRGLGLGIALGLVSAGYEVIAIARNTTKDFAAAAERANQNSPALHFVPFDLSEVDRIPDLAKRLRSDFGGIYGLVNNAAIGTSGILATMGNDKVGSMVQLNTVSPIILTKYMVRSMMTHGHGRIVNVSSIVGFTGYSGLSVYSATKAALIGFTKSLAREVGQLGINVNAVAPGFVDTEMTASLQDDHRSTIARRSALRAIAGNRRHRQCGRIPDGREIAQHHRDRHDGRRRRNGLNRPAIGATARAPWRRWTARRRDRSRGYGTSRRQDGPCRRRRSRYAQLRRPNPRCSRWFRSARDGS